MSKKFKYLPDDMYQMIGEYLDEHEISQLMRVSHTLRQGFLHQRRRQKMADQLLVYVMRGEQDNAERLIWSLPELLLISGTATDLHDRKFHAPAFSYALWALDTRHMCGMILRCVPDGQRGELIKKGLIDQYLNHEAQGINYEIEGSVVSNERHFNYLDLINASQFYISVISAADIFNREIIFAWARVGHAQSYLPINMAHEYCNQLQTFNWMQLDSFDREQLRRSLKLDSGLKSNQWPNLNYTCDWDQISKRSFPGNYYAYSPALRRIKSYDYHGYGPVMIDDNSLDSYFSWACNDMEFISRWHQQRLEDFAQIGCNLPYGRRPSNLIHKQQTMSGLGVMVSSGQKTRLNELLTARHWPWAQDLLLGTETFTDLSGRTFTCKAYEYALWAKDLGMMSLLERHMNAEVQCSLEQSLDMMQDHGLTFSQDGVQTRNSPHFELAPLKKALRAIINIIHGHQTPTIESSQNAIKSLRRAQLDLPWHIFKVYKSWSVRINIDWRPWGSDFPYLNDFGVVHANDVIASAAANQGAGSFWSASSRQIFPAPDTESLLYCLRSDLERVEQLEARLFSNIDCESCCSIS